MDRPSKSAGPAPSRASSQSVVEAPEVDLGLDGVELDGDEGIEERDDGGAREAERLQLVKAARIDVVLVEDAQREDAAAAGARRLHLAGEALDHGLLAVAAGVVGEGK